MTELFNKYKKQIINQVGKKALDNFQLEKLGKELIGSKFIGIFAQNELPEKNGYMIVNTDTSKKINSNKAHWIGVYQTPKTLYIYDSFGRHTKNVLKVISRKTTKKRKDSKHDAEQFGYSEVCGQLSLSWLCVAHDIGIRKALTI